MYFQIEHSTTDLGAKQDRYELTGQWGCASVTEYLLGVSQQVTLCKVTQIHQGQGIHLGVLLEP